MSEPRRLVTSQAEEDPTKNGDYVIEKILQKRIRNNVVSRVTLLTQLFFIFFKLNRLNIMLNGKGGEMRIILGN